MRTAAEEYILESMEACEFAIDNLSNDLQAFESELSEDTKYAIRDAIAWNEGHIEFLRSSF
jgi:hypothetical protein